MKNVIIINGDLFKTYSTEYLIQAYERGLKDSDAVYRRITIADLLFNVNKQFPNRSASELETDLKKALREIVWANHIVLFCPVFQNYIPSKVSGFFERLFNSSPNSQINISLYGRTGRIISILDDNLFQEYQLTKRTNFMAIKKEVFQRSHISPVFTSTIGHLYEIKNAYSEKWVNKLYNFGLKGL